MNSKRIAKNYFYNTAYQVLQVIAPLITAPYITRVLTVGPVSTVNYVYSIVTYFVLFGTLGSSLFGQREIAYYQNDPIKRSSVFKEIFAIRFVTMAVSILIYLFSFASFSRYKVIYLYMLFELFATMFDISWFFQGLEDFKKTVIRNFLVKLLSIVLIFLIIKSPNDVNKYAICFTLPTLIGNLSLWVYLPKYLKKSPFSVSSALKYIKPMLLLFLPQVAVDIYTVLDKTMIGALSSNFNDVGYYTYAQHIVKIMLQIITSLGIVVLPAMANAFAENRKDDIDKMMKNSFKFVFALGAPIMFGIAAIANTFVVWFYGKSYGKTGNLICIIAPIIMLIGISTVIGRQYLLPAKMQKAFTLSVVMGAVINALFNVILIIPFGAMGASVATVIAEFAVVLVQIICIRKLLDIKYIMLSNLKYLFFGAVMFVAVYPIQHILSGALCTAVQIICGIIIYGLIMLITKDEIVVMFKDKAKQVLKRGK